MPISPEPSVGASVGAGVPEGADVSRELLALGLGGAVTELSTAGLAHDVRGVMHRLGNREKGSGGPFGWEEAKNRNSAVFVATLKRADLCVCSSRSTLNSTHQHPAHPASVQVLRPRKIQVS